MRYVLILSAAMMLSGFTPDKILDDPKDEARAQSIIAQLRCFVCRGQPLAQSDAALARDLRRLVRDKIAEGRSTDEIFSFITKRYGQDVLLNPPISRQSFILWVMPFFALLAGGFLLWRALSGARR